MNYLIRIFTVIVGVMVLVACEPPTPPAVPQSADVTATVPATATPLPVDTPTPIVGRAPTPRITTITVWESLPDPQIEALVADIEALQAEMPELQVTLRHYDSPEEFMPMLLAGQLDMDVVLASPLLLGSLWSAGQVAPMSDFFPPSYLDSFASITNAGAQQQNELWGLADTAGFHLLLFYNQDVVNTPPTTITDLQALAESLAPNTGRSLGLNSYEPLWVLPWLPGSEAWLTRDNGHITMDAAGLESALTLYAGWQDAEAGIAPLATYDTIRTQFLQGDLPLLIDGEWAILELANTETTVNWGVAPLPSIDEAGGERPAAPLVLGRYWAISREAVGNRAAAAAAFVEYITRPERQLDRLRRFGLLPTRRAALNDPFVNTNPAFRASTRQMLTGRSVPLGINTDAVLTAMRDPLRAVLDGVLTPEEAAALIQANLE